MASLSYCTSKQQTYHTFRKLIFPPKTVDMWKINSYFTEIISSRPISPPSHQDQQVHNQKPKYLTSTPQQKLQWKPPKKNPANLKNVRGRNITKEPFSGVWKLKTTCMASYFQPPGHLGGERGFGPFDSHLKISQSSCGCLLSTFQIT